MINETAFLGGRRVPGFGLSAVERQSPLPVGRYWIDIFDPQETAFRAWLTAHKASVRVLTTESFPPVGGYPGRVWRLFEVIAPTPWEGPGFPTIAGAEIKSSEDTSQRPPKEKDPLDKLGEIEVPISIARPASWALAGVILVVAVVGGVLLVRYLPRPAPPAPPPTPPVEG